MTDPARRALSEHEARTISERIGSRYRMLVLTATACALSLDETLSLRLKDIDAGTMTVTVRDEEAAVTKVLGLPETILRGLQAYVLTYRSKTYMFESEANERIEPAVVERAWEDATTKLGLHGARFEDLHRASESDR